MAFADDWDLTFASTSWVEKESVIWTQFGFFKMWRFQFWWQQVFFMQGVEMWADFHFVIHAWMAPASRIQSSDFYLASHSLRVTFEMIFATLFVLVTGFAFYKWLRRDRGPPTEDEPIESQEDKVARYNRCGMSEVSGPDFWMEVRHFEEDPLARDKVDGCDLDCGRHNPNFIDWRKNHEIALLMVMQKFFTEMNTMGRIKSWQAMWQLKQLFKVGVLEEQHCLLQMGLQSLHGDYTAYLDDNTFKAVYEPRGTYQGDFGELVRFLTRRYLSSHDFGGESMHKEMLEFLRDLDLDDLERRQLQIDRNNDCAGPALEEMQAARERAIASLEEEISAARENNDLERVQLLQDRFDFLYVLWSWIGQLW